MLVLSAHPDDAELGCGGSIRCHVRAGHRVGLVDLTQGEKGTRGTPALRGEEAARSAEVLGVSFREKLSLPDGFLSCRTEQMLLTVVEAIRRHRPRVILTAPPEDRHPDHEATCRLVKEACFLAGLTKIKTQSSAHRPEKLYSYVLSTYLSPDLLVDITDSWQDKMEAIRCFSSQFEHSSGQATFISSPHFLPFVEARAREFGILAGVKYAEGFVSHQPLKVQSLLSV